MPTDFKRVRYLGPKISKLSYHIEMKALQDSMAMQMSDIAAFRIHVITHYYKYGLRSTLDAFNIKQSTFYDWKWAYERNHRRVIALVPKKTRPKNVRRMETDWRIVDFIKQMRIEHGNIGKSMLKPFVDAYCRQLGIKSISETTIQKIVKRRHFTFEKKYMRRSKQTSSKN